ncbi:hypothetical protein BDZ89DRAFT_1225103 [Hymenopellis radicata]|nr:hypothetical protein BDZ89DRAFT_1225103 [Hymenopellis radicata]
MAGELVTIVSNPIRKWLGPRPAQLTVDYDLSDGRLLTVRRFAVRQFANHSSAPLSLFDTFLPHSRNHATTTAHLPRSRPRRHLRHRSTTPTYDGVIIPHNGESPRSGQCRAYNSWTEGDVFGYFFPRPFDIFRTPSLPSYSANFEANPYLTPSAYPQSTLKCQHPSSEDAASPS